MKTWRLHACLLMALACGETVGDRAGSEASVEGGSGPGESARADGGTSNGGASSGGPSPGGASSGSAGMPMAGSGPDPLAVVDVNWLKERLGSSDLQLIDARADYIGGHIPGAVPLNPIVLVDAASPISGQVMPPAEAEGVLRSLGLRNEATFVVYGGPPEYDPARTVWALRYYGHSQTYYLDGGFGAWTDAGGDVARGAPASQQTSAYSVVEPNTGLRIESDDVLAALGEAPYDAVSIQLVDARSQEEWDAGHIPTATHVPWTETLSGGALLQPAELRTLYEGLDPAVTTVTYCLVGWRASVAWLSLTELGFEDVRVYDGSWREWGEPGAGFPIETR